MVLLQNFCDVLAWPDNPVIFVGSLGIIKSRKDGSDWTQLLEEWLDKDKWNARAEEKSILLSWKLWSDSEKMIFKTKCVEDFLADRVCCNFVRLMFCVVFFIYFFVTFLK